eukprot:207376_1
MSLSLELYNDYQCSLLVTGYVRLTTNKLIPVDICGICTHQLQTASNISTITMDKIEYLLLSHTIPCEHTSIFDNVTSKELNNYIKISHTIPCEHTSIFDNVAWKDDCKYISDNKLLKSLFPCLVWSCHFKWVFSDVLIDLAKDESTEHTNEVIFIKYLDTIIHLTKKGIDLKYKYMSQLITMYEHYYFDLYVLKAIKIELNIWNLNDNIQSVHFMKELQQCMNEKLRMLSSFDNSNFSVSLEEWNNNFSMKMNSLLKTIVIRNQTDIGQCINELNIIIEIIKVKYKLIQNQISTLWDTTLSHKILQYHKVNMATHEKIVDAVLEVLFVILRTILRLDTHIDAV